MTQPLIAAAEAVCKYGQSLHDHSENVAALSSALIAHRAEIEARRKACGWGLPFQVVEGPLGFYVADNCGERISDYFDLKTSCKIILSSLNAHFGYGTGGGE
jgi:hypothetical protein